MGGWREERGGAGRSLRGREGSDGEGRSELAGKTEEEEEEERGRDEIKCKGPGEWKL